MQNTALGISVANGTGSEFENLGSGDDDSGSGGDVGSSDGGSGVDVGSGDSGSGVDVGPGDGNGEGQTLKSAVFKIHSRCSKIV